MDHNLDSNHVARQGRRFRQEINPKTAKKSLTSSRNTSQQPGRYLCVDTRKDQVFPPKVPPNSSYTHNSSTPNTRSKQFGKDVQDNLPTKRSLKTVQNTTVQPDSHCKFKTTLAIEYVRDILEENATNSRPAKRQNTLKKTGQMKQLLGGGLSVLEPNVTKCLGIQNDRKKKTITLDNGLEVREEMVTPDITRFSSAVKQNSQNTLMVDMRKLSLADQTETTTSDDGIMFGERQENDAVSFVKNKKRSLIYHRDSDLSEFEYSKNNRNRSDYLPNHDISDDENIDDVHSDHVDHLTSHRFDHNRYNQDMDVADYSDGFRDCRSGKHQVEADQLDFIDDVIVSNNNIRDSIADNDGDLVSGDETSDDAQKVLEDENIYETEQVPKDEEKNIDRSKINYESGQGDFINDKEDLGSYRKPSTPERNEKTRIKNETEESDLNHRNIEEPQHNLGDGPLPESSGLTTPSQKQGSPDQDSIQVKDIWKALVDGGYDISREEVSKYKVNSTKRRIKSAPARRRSPRSVRGDYPMRARSAVNRDDGCKKECLEDAETDAGQAQLNPKLGGFMQARAASENRLKQSQRFEDKSSMEVVAVSKPVTKLPRKKSKPVVPPLNFQINTIPKSGHFFYFAYGLNMNQKRLEIQLKCQTGVQYWGLLFGFKLLFNKKGSAQGGVGFPNIVHEPGFSVEGCVYELSLDCLPLLDTCVGFPKHYSRLVVPVWLCNSSNVSEHGVAQHCVPAVVYVAQDEWISGDPAQLDTSFTLKQVVLGTDLLTSNYQMYLDNLKQRTTDGSGKYR